MENKIRRIRHQLKTCARLTHPNILRVYGHTSALGPAMTIVGPLAWNVNLMAYLENEDKNLTAVRRFQILRDIMARLQYHCHSRWLVWVKCTCSSWWHYLSCWPRSFPWCTPRLWTSLGLPGLQLHGLSMTGSCVAWIMEKEFPLRPSEHSELYSFGDIMLQVYHYLGEAAVVLCIASWVKPMRSRYPAFSDKYWVIEARWSIKPPDRSSAEGYRSD